MLVFHTAGLPPRNGKIILATIGCTVNSNAALAKMVIEYMSTNGVSRAGGGRALLPSSESNTPKSRTLCQQHDRIDSTLDGSKRDASSANYSNGNSSQLTKRDYHR